MDHSEYIHLEFGERISQENLKKLLKYDAETGTLTWKHNWPGIKKGQVTGNYKTINIGNISYKVTYLIYFWMTGTWPEPRSRVEFKDGDKSNHRWDNLKYHLNS